MKFSCSAPYFVILQSRRYRPPCCSMESTETVGYNCMHVSTCHLNSLALVVGNTRKDFLFHGTNLGYVSDINGEDI